MRCLARCLITHGAPSGRSAARPPPACQRSVVRSSRRSAAVHHRPTGRRAVGASARLPSAHRATPPARSSPPASASVSVFASSLGRSLFLLSSPQSFFLAGLVSPLLFFFLLHFFCTEYHRLVGFLSLLSCESLPELLPAVCCWKKAHLPAFLMFISSFFRLFFFCVKFF